MDNFRIFLFSQLYSLTPYFLYRQLYFVFLNVFSLDHMHHTEFGVHDKKKIAFLFFQFHVLMEDVKNEDDFAYI